LLPRAVESVVNVMSAAWLAQARPPIKI
jgi:hypothetical protein